MATYNIKAMYEYEGTVEADSQEEAEKIFLDELNDHYQGTYSYECEEVCAECDQAIEDCYCDEEDDEEEGE